MARGYPDFSRDAIIRGIDPAGVLKIVAVDEAGRIQGVFYGKDYNTQSLKILGVDTEGNIIARITGQDSAGNIKTVLTDTDGRLQTVALGKNYQQNILQPIGVDQNGFLSAILKGQYGTELKTAAVDSEGRLIVISSDYFEAFNQVYRLSLASIADRLVVKPTVYPVGKILFYEDFETSINKCFYVTGDTLEISIAKDFSYVGSQSLKIVLDNTPYAYANLYLLHSQIPSQFYTFEISFFPNADYSKICLEFDVLGYTDKRYAYVCYSYVNKNVSIIDQNGSSVVVLTNVYLPPPGQGWCHACLRVDAVNKKYVFAYFNEYFVNLTNYFMPALNTNMYGLVVPIVFAYPTATNRVVFYFDKFVFGIGD